MRKQRKSKIHLFYGEYNILKEVDEDIMDIFKLEFLKSILQGYVILHTWNDEKEDFDILCESTVGDFEKDIPKEFWQKEVLEMNPGTVDGDACIIIDLN